MFEVKGRTKVDANGVKTPMLSFGESLAVETNDGSMSVYTAN